MGEDGKPAQAGPDPDARRVDREQDDRRRHARRGRRGRRLLPRPPRPAAPDDLPAPARRPLQEGRRADGPLHRRGRPAALTRRVAQRSAGASRYATRASSSSGATGNVGIRTSRFGTTGRDERLRGEDREPDVLGGGRPRDPRRGERGDVVERRPDLHRRGGVGAVVTGRAALVLEQRGAVGALAGAAAPPPRSSVSSPAPAARAPAASSTNGRPITPAAGAGAGRSCPGRGRRGRARRARRRRRTAARSRARSRRRSCRPALPPTCSVPSSCTPRTWSTAQR